MSEDNTPAERSPKAKEAAASDVDGLHADPNKLDDTEAVQPFDEASRDQLKQELDKPDAALQLNVPAPVPGGDQQQNAVPGPMGPDELQAARDAFREEMLVKKVFNRKARDVDREH